MSLINDALKRAKENQAQPGPARSLTITMKPVETQPGPRWPLLLVPLALLAILGLAALLIVKGWKSENPAASATEPPSLTVQARESAPSTTIAETQPQPPQPQSIPQASKAAAAPTPALSQPMPAAASAGAQPPATASLPTGQVATSPAPPSFPDLKLQGIFFRNTNPSVLINKQTLYQGDLVDGAKVIQITRQSVTLQFQGETKVLKLY